MLNHLMTLEPRSSSVYFYAKKKRLIFHITVELGYHLICASPQLS